MLWENIVLIGSYKLIWIKPINWFSPEKKKYGLYYKHIIVPITDQYKYLGLLCTSNGKLKFAFEQLSERSEKAYKALKSSLPANNNLSI